MAMDSWRVFFENENDRSLMLAVNSKFQDSEGFEKGIESGQLRFQFAKSVTDAAALMDLLIPHTDQVHIFTTPKNSEKPALLRGKHLIPISRTALAREYARFDRFHARFEKTWAEAQNTSLKRAVGASKREVLAFLRRARRHPLQWALAEAVAKERVDFDELKALSLEKPTLLLHVCCGPDAGGVIQQLKNDFKLTCFWYDPNIQPKEEHDKRLEAFEKVARIEGIPFITGEYDVDTFFERIKGLEHTPEQGAKCSQCYDLRLERSAQEASEHDFDLYATTLAISPHKVQSKLINFGELNHKRYGVPYYHRNFMKEDGFKDSVQYSHEHDIFRQDYCGCIYSLKDGGPDARSKMVPTPEHSK